MNISRHRGRRRGVVLLIVVSLLALFILLGITYSLAVSHYLTASKIELQQGRLLDQPETEADLVFGQILYDTAARTVLQYQSLLRDLYGYDANTVSNASSTINSVYPQYRETIQGTVFNVNSGPGTNPPTWQNGSTQGGQFFTFTFTLPLTPAPAGSSYYAALSPIPNYYAGRVITFQSGACANQSTRIVAYNPVLPNPNPGGSPATAAMGQFTIELIESKLAGPVTPSIQDQFIVNGAPFNGTGSGYYYNVNNPTGDSNNFGVNNLYAAPDFTQPDTQNPGQYLPLNPYSVALLPNIGAYDMKFGKMPVAYDFGGLDETWDAPDLQNPFLAMVPPRAAESYYAGSPLPIIPSYHRPELINYWINNSSLQSESTTTGRGRLNTGMSGLSNINAPFYTNMTQAERDFLRTIIFRPMPWDHPNFTGSNPAFSSTSALTLINNLINANNLPLWDVDNDGDGVPDSIWIDPGLPVITMPDGRRVKRLAAIMVKDLDGSVNLNAHGSLAQTTSVNRAEYAPVAGMLSGYTPPPQGSYSSYAYALGLAPALYGVPNPLNPASTYTVPRGMGFGPAEVDFLQLLTGTTPAYTDTAALQAYSNLLRGRYASNVVSSGPLYDTGTNAVPGWPTVTNTSTAADYRDALAAVKNQGLPNDYAFLNPNASSIGYASWYGQPSWYASPPDVWGRSAVVLDVGGQPLFAYAGQYGEATDSPYEICLSGENNNADSPYTVAELERLLRYHDSDASQLPGRILTMDALAGTNASGYYRLSSTPGVVNPVIGDDHRRKALTTLSSDIPVPATPLPQEMRSSMATSLAKVPGASSILDLYYARRNGLALSGNIPLLYEQMAQITPWEFFKGQKFDINRPFGDGTDTNGDGVRDDPTEAANGEYAWQGGNNTALPDLPATFSSTGSTKIYSQQTNSVIVNPVQNVGNAQATTSQRDNMFARHLYARHLFCLAMLMLPPDFSGSTVSSFPTSGHPTDPALNSRTAYQYAIIRRIAQWAVNCVDFRDSDSVMTPFEFDYNPWDGWHVDGDPATDGVNSPERLVQGGVVTPYTWANASASQRGLVWGCESPDLLITETLGLHDRRVADTSVNKKRTDMATMQQDDTASPGMGAGGTLDQYRIPQGSLFVELYCPRATRWSGAGEVGSQKPQLTTELYNTAGQLQLGALSAQKPNGTPDAGARWPVWRLAMSRLQRSDMTTPDANQQQNHPLTVLRSSNSSTLGPESATFDQINYDGSNWKMNVSQIPTVTAPLTIDRFAYLGNASSLPSTETGRSFYSTQFPQLFPGQYALVGPRDVTYLGSQDYSTASPSPVSMAWGGRSPQKIQLSGGGGVMVTDTTSSPGHTTSRTAGTDMRPPLGVICAIPTVNPANNQPLVPMTCGSSYSTASPSATWTSGSSGQIQWPIGMNVTEPLPIPVGQGVSANYYPDSAGTWYSGSDTYGSTPADFYADPNDSAAAGALDGPAESPLSASATASPARPIAANNMTHTQTYFDCSAVFLQRLANPAWAYNPPPYDASGNADPFYNSTLPVNPYITVDWQTIDVHVFNGEENRYKTAQTGVFDVDDDPSQDTQSVDPKVPDSRLRFRSRQRGYVTVSTSGGTSYQPTSNPWPPVTDFSFPYSSTSSAFYRLPYTSLAGTVNGPFFSVNLLDSQSNTYLYNGGLGSGTAPNASNSAADAHTLGYLNSTVDYPYSTAAGPTYATYVGEPYMNPFPWLAWNNRPFTSPMELLNVPAASPSRMFLEMTPGYGAVTTSTNGSASAPTNSAPQSTVTLQAGPYADTSNTTTGYGALRLPFGQMLNFFQTTMFNPANPATMGLAPHFYRLLDFVEVPSPYSGAERWYNPQNFGWLNSGAFYGGPTSTVVTPASNFYRPPFNKLSRFRDPGKVNINTIFDYATTGGSATIYSDIWDSVVGQFPGMRGVDNMTYEMLLSRQGDYGAAGGIYAMNTSSQAYPTRFANPFRTADSADLMPAVGSGGYGTYSNMRKSNPVEATLLRPDPNYQVSYQASGQQQPLFQMNQNVNYQFNNWVGSPPGANPPNTTYVGAYHDVTRNPYFDNQALQKIGNVLTTRSNCFAIWITIGYFEVEEYRPNGTTLVIDAAHPDGFALGQEVGADTGEVKRHRAFYIVDRSVPVGFSPGSRLNTDDCVLVRRLIE